MFFIYSSAGIVSLITTAPAYLRTFALFAYIAGFTDNRNDYVSKKEIV